jgi:hypothetical protein
MVAKISTGGNMFGALAYNQNKVDSEEAKVLFSNKMLLSENGNFSIGECMRSFEMQMPVQLSTKKPILHISINPHPEDVLTDQQLSDIAKEYMRKLGYGDQPYLVYKHTDIDRHHIHIVGLRVDESGRPLNDRFEHRRSKQITRELERKYNLHPAERKERAERPELKKVDYAAGREAPSQQHRESGLLWLPLPVVRGVQGVACHLQRVRRGSQGRDKRQTLSGDCLFRHQ